MPTSDTYDIAVVGGGFFGMNIAEHFALRGKRVLLLEKQDACMTRASYVNQARIHNGYHYPRSILTAMRSRISFPRFVKDFPECVVNDFTKYYGIGKILSKVNAKQFAEFCNRIGAECEEAPSAISGMFDSHFIEKVFLVKEYAFDSSILCRTMLSRIQAAGVELVLSASAERVEQSARGLLLHTSIGGRSVSISASHVFNCTYSNLNYVNHNSGIPLIPLKYEMTEMALVDVPDELKDKSFTIMCGPFFSIMPFPSRNLYTLSHVRYTPHYEWYDRPDHYISPLDIYRKDRKETAFPEMQHDSSRYLPLIRQCKYQDSLWEVKTMLPSSEVDDSRPILFKMNYGMNGYHCVMGGKIDNVYDIITTIEQNKEFFR